MSCWWAASTRLLKVLDLDTGARLLGRFHIFWWSDGAGGSWWGGFQHRRLKPWLSWIKSVTNLLWIEKPKDHFVKLQENPKQYHFKSIFGPHLPNCPLGDFYSVVLIVLAIYPLGTVRPTYYLKHINLRFLSSRTQGPFTFEGIWSIRGIRPSMTVYILLALYIFVLVFVILRLLLPQRGVVAANTVGPTLTVCCSTVQRVREDGAWENYFIFPNFSFSHLV